MQFAVTIGSYFYNRNGDLVRVTNLLNRTAEEGEDTGIDGQVLVTELIEPYNEE